MGNPLLRATLVVLSVLLPPDPSAASWQTDGVPLTLAPSSQTEPRIAGDGAGGAIVCWVDQRNSSADIYAQRVRADGTIAPGWPADGVAICTAADGQSQPDIVSDGAGGAIIVWIDRRGGNYTDIYAQRVTASGAIAAGWPAQGRAICTATEQQDFPTIASDGAQGAIIAWADYRNYQVSNRDIYATRVAGNGTVGGGAWPANGLDIAQSITVDSWPQATGDGSTGAFISWPGSGGGRIQHVTRDGALLWTPGGVLVAASSFTQGSDWAQSPLVHDGAGGVLVTWESTENIYVQRLTPAGTPHLGWPAEGFPCGFGTRANLAYDGNHGCIVTWYVQGTEEVFALRVDQDGSIPPGEWTAAGIVVCEQDGTVARIAPTGDGGAVVAWQDSRGPDLDIFAQWVGPDGHLASPAGGFPLCTAANFQQKAVLVSDDVGGAIVAWYDPRHGGPAQVDIYAQRVEAGPAGVGTGGVEHASRLLRVTPNPVHRSFANAVLTVSPVVSPDGSMVRTVGPLIIVDAQGRSIRRLPVEPSSQRGVAARIEWDLHDDAGRLVAPGVYWVRPLRGSRGAAARVAVLP
jgi:hypothetical protein